MFFNKINSNFEISMAKRSEKQVMSDSHFHNAHELYYLLNGEFSYFIENAVYSVKKGDMVLIPCDVIHKTQYKTKTNCKRILISFSDDFIADLKKDDPDILGCFSQKIISLSKPKQAVAENIMTQILNEFSGVYDPNFALVKCLFGELLILLCRHAESAGFQKNIQFTNLTSQKIIEIVEYINQNYKEDITLMLLSEKFFLSGAHLSKLFKSVTGFNYSEYLSNVRIKQGVDLLKNSDLNITEIAFSVGFNSSNHFCKSFKSVIGISPLKYKKML